ncbi:DEAD/DEAH box helicase [Kiritimatiella glycovorans]|uniref:ATP-dependent RNA helicase RhlB n=1 Tax=Kiritimatiella glycovorans TaxID=1307763 RepID=A0A0G3EII9_9BACT|nr:DEAD/DEAH box helicase [Kiritimatiella glycovorans]AKJ64630.1 ATP-dependent RNA helicase RhlB [Kiritimatiella glycovorans]
MGIRDWFTRKKTTGTDEGGASKTRQRRGRIREEGKQSGKTQRKGETWRPAGGEKEKPRRERPPEKNAATGDAKERPGGGKAAEKKWKPESFQVEPQEGRTRFHDFDLPGEVMRAIAELGFEYCTKIQAEILPHTLQGRDAAGQAQTGTGKTAAFLIQIFTVLLRRPVQGERKKGAPRALMVAPTRELVLQIEKDAHDLGKYTGFKTVCVYGGMDFNKQMRDLDGTVDLVVATPGRLLDFNRRRVIDLRQVEVLVLDEADRMLDMGFIPDVRKIVRATPFKDKRQTLLFSATLDESVMRLAHSWMTEPVRVEIEPERLAAEAIDQKVYITTEEQKFKLLHNILEKVVHGQALIFVNRRDQVDRLTDLLNRHGIPCEALSGAVNQKKRMRIIEHYKSGKIRCVVATDVAGRGLHVEDISHVINYNTPQNPEDYVHRIGRTGRAGSEGTSVTFASETEAFEIPAIEELLGDRLSCEHPPDELLQELPKPTRPAAKPRGKRDGGGSGSRRSGRSGRPRGRRSGGGRRRS